MAPPPVLLLPIVLAKLTLTPEDLSLSQCSPCGFLKHIHILHIGAVTDDSYTYEDRGFESQARGFETWSSQTKDFNIYSCPLPSLALGIIRIGLAQCQDNGTE